MRALTPQEVRQAVRGRWLSRYEPVPILGVSIDSRQAGEGDLFVAIRGDRFDGHDFLSDAADRGCVAAVIDASHTLSPEMMQRFPAGVIGVADTRAALLDLGAFYRTVIPANVVAVTGSNGKTSVKRMIDHILSNRLTGTASPQSYNNEIGVPLTLLSAGAGDDYVVCEVGTSAPGEIARLARAVRPNIAVITSIAPAHLEKLHSLDQIAVEKAALLGWIDERGVAVVTADSPELDHALKSYQRMTIRFGVNDSAQLRLTGYESDGTSQRFQINDRQWVELSLPGRHNALNAMAAIAVAARFGYTQEEAGEALRDFGGVEMRLEILDCGSLTVLNDTYNANPGSMLAAAGVLGEQKARRRVLVAGAMLELGEQAQNIHMDVGRELATRRVDLVVGVGELGASLAEGAARAGCRSETYKTLAEAKKHLPEILQDGDAVLLKGSRAMKMESLLPVLQTTGGADGATETKPNGRKNGNASSGRSRKRASKRSTGKRTSGRKADQA